MPGFQGRVVAGAEVDFQGHIRRATADLLYPAIFLLDSLVKRNDVTFVIGFVEPRPSSLPMHLPVASSQHVRAHTNKVQGWFERGGGVGMGVSGMVFVGLVLGCIEAKFCK